MRLRNAIKQSCDIYFYEVARLLGVDRLSILAKRYGLGSKVLGGLYIDEKIGIVPSTKWKLETLRASLVLRRNYYHWYRARLYSVYTSTTVFNDSSTCKWWL